jgi:hypothetical protein
MLGPEANLEPILLSAADNKRLMQAIYAAIDNRDSSLFVEHLADDATWQVMGQYSWSHTFKGREAILNGLHGHVRTRIEGRPRTVAHRFIADGELVVIEAKGDNVTKDGVRYDNDYCMVFRLQDGKMIEIREYCDSTLTEAALGPFPPERVPA